MRQKQPEVTFSPEGGPVGDNSRAAVLWEGFGFDRERRIADLACISPETVDVLRPALWGVVGTAMAACIDPHTRQSVQLTGNALDWELFGRYAEPLPVGLVWVHGFRSSMEVRPDSRLLFGIDCREDSQKMLMQLGLAGILASARVDIGSRSGEIASEITALIQLLPEYRFLQLFKMQQSAEIKQLPLSDFLRIAREAQVIRELADRYGKSVYDDPRYPAMLARNLLHIDEETMPRSTTQDMQLGAVQRAREYFTARLLDEVAEHGYSGASLGRIVQNDEDELLIAYINGAGELVLAGHYDEIFDSIQTLGVNISRELGEPRSSFQQLLGAELVANFMQRVVDPRVHDDFDVILQHATQQTVRYILELVHDGEMRYLRLDPLLQLRKPRGEEIPLGLYLDHSSRHTQWHHDHPNDMVFVSGADRIHNDKITIGTVINAPPGDRQKRLILMAAREEPLDGDPASDVLQIEFDTVVFGRDMDPYVPGYKINSRAGSRYGYIRSAEDPYTPTNVVIDERQRQTLAKVYDELGLGELASDMRGQGATVTVDRLVTLIRKSTLYPGQSRVFSPDNLTGDLPGTFVVQQLSDFSPFVESGKLVAQCSGSAKFLQLSLEKIFGSGVARLVSGNTMQGVDRISAEGHMQTTFTHDGRIYILDATGSASDSWGPSILPKSLRADAPKVAHPVIPVRQQSHRDETPEIDPAELRMRALESLQHVIEMQFRIFYKLPDQQALYKKVMDLPKHDPIRRTISIFARAARDGIAIEELDSLVAYLEAYRAAPKAILRQHKMAIYEEALFESLAGPLKQLRIYYML